MFLREYMSVVVTDGSDVRSAYDTVKAGKETSHTRPRSSRICLWLSSEAFLVFARMYGRRCACRHRQRFALAEPTQKVCRAEEL